MKRRSFIAASATAPLIALPLAASPYSDQQHLEHLFAISRQTGLSPENLVEWFQGVDLTRVVENVERAPAIKWGPVRTRSAIQTYKWGEIMTDNNPTQDYLESQIRRKADMDAAARCLSNFTNSGQFHPGLMDLAI
jgi:hypothetical protein